jgi:asparagine synthase (glutamine-hydrolysing)
MCGIVGIYNSQLNTSDNISLVKKMLSLIRYRGPDESGIYVNSQVTLGSVRLSIIDLVAGQQPLSTPDQKYWIVFNGEIFNYPELRSELEKKGIHFQTLSDTEVLLQAFIRWGTDCLCRMNGQFAFAIWNNEKKELFLARDRVGIRPLFYTFVNDTCIFGSEIKSILAYPDVNASIDSHSLSQVFTTWTTITPRTIFKDIYELPPGQYMRITANETIIKPYWTLSFNPDNRFRGSMNDAVAELEQLLTDSVKLRLRADVPVAAYLSGGIDSSATTALIKKVAPDSLQTFSIGFEENEFDETPWQYEVSKFLGTHHKAFTCTNDDIGRFFPQVVWQSEIPILRTAPVPMLCLSKKVRESNIKVVITGEGADEMLGGYDIFKEALIREFWSRQPDSLIRPLLFNKLYPYLAQFNGRNKSALKLFYGYRLTDTLSPFYSHLLRWHNTSSLLNYLSPDYRNSLNGYDVTESISDLLPEEFDSYDRLSKAQWLESKFFMSGYLLSSQGDRVSMANSVEGRYPFLDYRVIEFAASLPSEYKIKGLNEKYILKKMMSGRLPQSILKRPKQAYRAPMASGFFSKSGQEYIPDLIGEKGIKETGIFNYGTVARLFNKVQSGNPASEIENMALCGILSTQILMHQYVLKDLFRQESGDLTDCKIHRAVEG